MKLSKKEVIKFKKINSLLLKWFILFNLFIIVNSKINKKYNNRKLESLEQIKIKIIGKDTQNILNSDFSAHPTEIYVNENPVDIDNENKIYNLIEEENYITMKWENKLETFEYMFLDLTNIIEIDLSNIDTSRVSNMAYMFCGCSNLRSINLNNFDTSLVTTMLGMFLRCHSLTTLDLSSFNTSLVKGMSFMFNECYSLISLNLSNFNTSLVGDMNSMFNNCNSLMFLDLSNFNTSKITYMYKLFNNCSSLKSLDLSSFDTSSVEMMTSMFSYCSSLTSLDLSNFNTSKLVSMIQMFYQCNKLISINLSNFYISNCTSMINLFYNCSSLEFINISNFIEGDELSNDNMFDGVPNNLVFCSNNEENIPKILKELKNLSCPVNDCSDNWKINQKIIIDEKNICVDNCFEDTTYPYEYKKQCYNNCPEGTRPNKNNICLIDCPDNLSFEKNGECTEKCIIQDFYNNICIINNKNIKAKEYIVNGTINEIIDGSINFLLLNLLNEEKKDLIIKDENEIYQITSVYNQNNKLYNDREITINIGECENILKNQYKINNDETLIIFKMDYFIDGFLIPITEYEIFHPQTKEKLDLKYCNDMPINIFIPVIINEDYLYKHNPDSEYYKECENDNLLNERISEFNNNNLSLCEKDCLFKEYNKNTKKVLCECTIKNNFMHLSEILNKKNELLYHIIQKAKDSILLKNESKIYELLTFSSLVEKKYIPVVTKESMNIVLNIFVEALKNNTINSTKDEIIFGKNITFHMTTPENQNIYIKNNLYTHISSIDLKKCEDLLKTKNHISKDDSLIILKVDIKRNDTDSTQIEYEIFNPNTLEKLNLSICDDIPIDIYPPIDLNQNIYSLVKHLKEQGYDLFDSSDDFYNDICSPYNSFNDTDVIIKDRKYDFYDSNITLCEDTCEYKEFYIISLKARCECDIKTEVKSNVQVKFAPNKVIENFYKIEKYTNIKAIACFKLVFSLKGQKNNYGSYTIIGIAIIFITLMIINFGTINTKIESIIKNISFKYNSLLHELNEKKDKKELKHNKKTKNSNNDHSEKNEINKKHDKNILNLRRNTKTRDNANNQNKKTSKCNIFNIDKKQKNQIIKKNKIEKTDNNNSFKKLITYRNKDNSKYKRNTINNIEINKSYKASKIINNYKLEQKKNSTKNIDKNNNKKINQIINFISKERRYIYFCDDELNNLNYEDALSIDFRSFIQFYLSLLKQNNLFIFTFIVKNDYNIFLLKISLFFITFALFYFMNTIFFVDDSIHKIYEEQGKYNIYIKFLKQYIVLLLHKYFHFY